MFLFLLQSWTAVVVPVTVRDTAGADAAVAVGCRIAGSESRGVRRSRRRRRFWILRLSGRRLRLPVFFLNNTDSIKVKLAQSNKLWNGTPSLGHLDFKVLPYGMDAKAKFFNLASFFSSNCLFSSDICNE